MHVKVILENEGTLMFVIDWYKNQKLCNKAVDNYAHALESLAIIAIKHKKCAIKPSNLIILQYSYVLTNKRLWKLC